MASNESGLTDGKGIVWDSGKVASSREYGVEYAGTPLAKTSSYWWTVRIWDGNDQPSPPSSPKRFVTSFFTADDWAAGIMWIKPPPAKSSLTASSPPSIFRKVFQVRKPVKQAFLYISGLGQFVSFINGTKVGNHVMDPAWTDYDRTIDYVTFDVTGQVREGANAIGVMLANGWLGDKLDRLGTRNFGPMRLRAQLHAIFDDGTSQDIVSDPSWKVAASPLIHSEIHGSEKYDARLEQLGWTSPGFDDAKWVNAAVAEPAPGVLVSQNAPPIVARQTFAAQKVTHPASGICVYDFGQNMSGQFQITVDGDAGATVEIQPGECLNAKGRVNGGRAEKSEYTLKGGGPETWGLQFNSTGFRYVELRNATTKELGGTLPVVTDVTAFFVCTAARDVSTFEASDARYVQIHDLAKQTILSNTGSIHTDGPNYERLGWQEVVWTTLPSSLYCWDEQTLFTKIMRDVRDAQRVGGLCPNIAPQWFYTIHTPPGDKYDDAPCWGSSAIISPWALYQAYGDAKILADQYETMKRYMAYLKTKESDGLIKYGLGDWMAPAGNSVANVEGAVYVFDTRLMAEIAAVLGKSDDAKRFRQDFERVRAAYQKAHFDVEAQAYVPINQADEALPLYFDIVPENSIAGVRQALVAGIVHPRANGSPSVGRPGEFGPVLADHITAGDIGVSAVWQALGEAGENDLVQTMIMQTSSPSYTYMINQGATTIAEDWKYEKTRSHNHDMYAGILAWLYDSVAGISALKPGYEEIRIKPVPPAGLKHAAARYDSVRGPIESSWSVEGSRFNLDVTIPANTSAVIYIPTTDSGSVRESGMAATAAKGVQLLRSEGGTAVFSATSGHFSFESAVADNKAAN